MLEKFPSSQLQREVLEYKFPDNGGEFIEYQINRYIEHLKNDSLNNLDHTRETLIKTAVGETAILRQDEFGIDQVLCNLTSINGFSNYDLSNIFGSQHTIISIWHHIDLDGITAGAIVYKAFNNTKAINKNNKICLCPYNYTGPKTVKQSCYATTAGSAYKYHNKIAIVVDLNLTKEELLPILESYNHVLYIDHHSASITNIKSIQYDRSKTFNFLVDTRYSAAYLCYILFKDVIKKTSGYQINDILPSIVSMMDTRTVVGGDGIWSQLITVNKSIIPFLIGRQFKYKNSPTIRTYNGEENILGKHIYVKLKSDPVENLAYKYGIALNQYFVDMEGMEVHSNIWKSLFKDLECLKSTIDTGTKLLELSKAKNSILYENDVKYNAEYKDNYIKAIIAANSSKLNTRPNGNSFIRMIFRQKRSPDTLSFSIYTDDPVFKKINLGSIVELISDGSGGGHSGAAGGVISIEKVDKWFSKIINSKGGTAKQELARDVFKHSKFWVTPDTNHIRYDPVIYKAFKVICTIIFTEYEKYEKKGK